MDYEWGEINDAKTMNYVLMWEVFFQNVFFLYIIPIQGEKEGSKKF